MEVGNYYKKLMVNSITALKAAADLAYTCHSFGVCTKCPFNSLDDECLFNDITCPEQWLPEIGRIANKLKIIEERENNNE